MKRKEAELVEVWLDKTEVRPGDTVNVQLFGNQNNPQGYIQNIYQGTDNFTKLAGRHTIKIGYDIHDIIASNTPLSVNITCHSRLVSIGMSPAGSGEYSVWNNPLPNTP